MTVQIQFPDGSSRSFDTPVTGLKIAESISNSLRKKSVAIRVNDDLQDLTREIETDCTVELITRDTDEGLEVIRHDAAHVLAEAVKELFPETQVTIGPAIENGFYYDFVRDDPFTQEDFEKIEVRMKDIVKRNEEIVREVWQRDDAIEYFESIGESYKAEIIGDLPKDEVISVYRQGDFLDLCRGPHLPSTGVLGHAFKLTKLAGAYWRGDAKNAQLQRIYGTAWANDQQLKQYLRQLEEAEKRDHRLLGKQLGLFHMQEEAPGMVFWHPKGWSIYQSVKQYMRHQQEEHGYQEINTPQLVDFSLWEKSGHADKFGDDMFSLQVDERTYAVKPMNCPCHVQVYNQGLTSYRELPLRLAEFGSCHRNEMSGALHGIMRVRGFVQDDAHIFCTEGQIQSEVASFINFLHDVYQDFGFEEVLYKLSTRPEKRVGSDEVWDRSEAALAEALDAKNLDWDLQPGEGAFYGPKIEFSLRDCIGRVWQCGTIQVDFSTPGRLDAEYIGEDGNKHVPVMLHRAILGSLERFIGILIEQHAGALPFWLSPIQVVIATIVSDADGYATEVLHQLTAAGIRAELDIRNEKISYKVREHSLQKVPIIAAIGMREAAENTLAIRRFGSKHQKVLAVDEFLEQLALENIPGYKSVAPANAESSDQNVGADA
ncbi:MAG TPA: threonine--tRNA ligase [Gammaproteobacteria bacterium]|jgi:threonyl-tRNA synthetase|nr:threonine--tRNA ligase [Gammaproteobacteria bacterium]